jgi:hypothetical protein
MINKEYFLERLRAGEELSDIGNEIAEFMNEAQEAYDTEVRAKAVADAKAKEEKAQRKMDIMSTISSLLNEYIRMECPGLIEDEDCSEAETASLMASTDSILKMLTSFNDIFPVDKDTIKMKKTTPSDDEIIKNFIRDLRF